MDGEDLFYLVATTICIATLVAMISSLSHDRTSKDIARDCERHGAFYINDVRYECKEQPNDN